MAQKFLNGVHISGTTQLDFMPSYESEGIITLGRYDSNTSRYHNIKSYVSSTEASNYLKFSLHNGTTNTVVDVLTLNGNKAATFAGKVRANSWFQGADGTNTLWANSASGVLIQTPGSTSNDNDSKIYFRNHGTTIKHTFDTSNGNATFVGNLHIGTGTPNGVLDIHAANGNWRVNRYGGMYFRNSSNATHESYIHPRSDGSLSIGRVAESNWSGSGVSSFAATTYDHLTFDTSSTATFSGTGQFNGSGHGLTLFNGTNGTTSKLLFKNTDNTDTSKFIRGNAYYLEFGSNQNEGFKFTDVQNSTTLLQINGGNNSSGNGANSATFAGDVIINGAAPTLRIQDSRNLNNGEWDNVSLGNIEFYTSDTTSPGARVLAEVEAYSNAAAASGPNAELRFKTSQNGDSSPQTRLTISHDGNATFTGHINGNGYIQAFGLLYLRSSVQVMNKAADGFLNLASRDTSGSEVVYNMATIGNLTASGEIEGGSLDINGNSDISGTITSGAHTINSAADNILTLNQTGTDTGWSYINFNTSGTRQWYVGMDNNKNFDIYNDSIDSLGLTINYINNNATFTGTITASNFSGSSSGTNTGDQTLSSLGAAPSSHNHDDRYYTETESKAKFTSTDGTTTGGSDYTFKIDDEGNFSGNKWYHVATIPNTNGGLHIRGFMSNHVESFASQKFDLAIACREGGSGADVEITGQLDVLHNATSGNNRAGIRVIKTADSSYDEYKVYVRTTQYSMVTLRLTQEGSVTFNTNHSSPLTSEPAGLGVELDTSTTVEGNYVVDNSAIKEIYHEGHLPTLSELGAQASGAYLTDLTGAVLTTTNQTIEGVKQFNDYINAAANIQMSGHLYNSTGNNSIDLIDHGNYTWFRNSSNSWVFQGGTGDDDWTKTFRFTLEGVGSGFNDKLMIIGQQQNNGTSGGKYKGVRIVKSTGSSSVVDGYLQAGDVVITGDLTVSGTTQTINQTNLDVSDNIIGLNRGATSNANDSGFIIERGSTGDNAAILWDESEDTFVFGTTTAVPSDTGNVALSAFMPIKTGALEVTSNISLGYAIKHIGDTGTDIIFSTGQILLQTSTNGNYLNIHNNGINYYNASNHNFTGAIVCNNKVTADGGFTSHNQRGVSTNPNQTEEYPLGHYTGGKEIWSLDPTWSNSQLQEYFNSSNVEWYEDSTAPAGYSIKIDGSVSTGGYYGSGFPYIPIEEGSIYLIEVYIRNESGSSISHYMGTQDFEHDFTSTASGSGNPGSYGYHLMQNHNPGTSWQHRHAFVSGHHNSDVGKFETGAKYFTPHSLFNYTHASGTRRCYISGWKVTRIAEQEFFAQGTAAKPAIVLHDGVYDSVPNSGLYREWYDGTTATKDQVSVSTDGTRRLRINEAGVWTDQNFYVGGDWRTFSSTWDASAGTSGAGFRFHNTHADTNGVVALTVSATGNAVFAGEVEAASLDINGNADISGTLQLSTLQVSGDGDFGGGGAANCRLSARGSTDDNTAYALEAANHSGASLFIVRNDGLTTMGNINSGAITSSGNIQHAGLTMTTGTDIDQVKEFTMSFQLAANTWTDTGIDGTDLTTGTYIMQVYVDDYGVGGGHYTEYYSATISWFSTNTNDGNVDEIVIHRAGHAPTSGDVQFRTERTVNADSHDLMLQVKHNQAYNAALDNNTGKSMRFKFRRLI